ncbi:hypothetical protein PC128_g23290 [Phytophthora cactorum]|nr:hypothetical protein PC128_g23290 [Phytophthora cactorum]
MLLSCFSYSRAFEPREHDHMQLLHVTGCDWFGGTRSLARMASYYIKSFVRRSPPVLWSSEDQCIGSSHPLHVLITASQNKANGWHSLTIRDKPFECAMHADTAISNTRIQAQRHAIRRAVHHPDVIDVVIPCVDWSDGLLNESLHFTRNRLAPMERAASCTATRRLPLSDLQGCNHELDADICRCSKHLRTQQDGVGVAKPRLRSSEDPRGRRRRSS